MEKVKCNWPEKIKEHAVLIIICICAMLLHGYQLTSLPYGMHVDEAGMAYDAWCLANYGVDRYLYSFPVYLNNFGGGQSVLYAYLCAGLIKIFGFSMYAVRLPGFLFSMLTLFFGVKIVSRKYGDEKRTCVFAVLFLIVPYFFMAGRLGLDCNLMLGMSTVFLYYYLLAAETGKYWAYAVAGISGGLVLYTYVISYLVLPLFLLLSVAYLLAVHRIRVKQLFVFGCLIAVLALPLILVQYVNMTGAESFRIFGVFTVPVLRGYRLAEITVPSLKNLYVSLKSILFFDWLEYNSLSQYGVLYYVSLPFFAVGFGKVCYKSGQSIYRRQWDMETMLLLWFVAELVTGMMLGGDGPNVNKLNGVFMVELYFVMTGVCQVLGWKAHWRRVVSIAAGALYVVSSVGFFYYYFVTQKEADTFMSFFGPDIAEGVAFVEENEEIIQDTVYISVSYIYFLAGERISPYEFSINENGELVYQNYVFKTVYEEIDPEGCYIVSADHEYFMDLLMGEGYSKKSFDGHAVMYKCKEE